MNGKGRPDVGEPGEAQLLGNTSVASYYGPSFMIDDLTYHYEDADHTDDTDQLPLPDRRELLCAAVRHHRQEVGGTSR